VATRRVCCRKMIHMLNVGFHRHIVTPPIGVYLTGYGARTGPSVGVLDDLVVDATTFREGEEGVIWINADILSFGAEHVGRIRERIMAEIGVPAERVALCASHTHAGPEVASTHLGDSDPEYVQLLERWAVSAACVAWNDASPAKLRIGKGTCHISRNRRRPEGGPVDPDVLTLQWIGDRPGGIVMHTCHGVVLGSDNRRFSADYCGVTRRTMEHVLSTTQSPSSPVTQLPNYPITFTNGCTGDINPLSQGEDKVVPYGRTLAFEALKAMEASTQIATTPIDGASSRVDLPVVDPPPPDECQARIVELETEWKTSEGAQKKMAGIFANWAKERLRQVESGTCPTSQAAEVQAFRIGDFGIVFLPGEPLVRLGLQIKATSPAPHTWAAGYCNGTVGYVADEESWQHGGYEVLTAPQFYAMGPYKPEAGRILVDCGLDLLRRLFQQ